MSQRVTHYILLPEQLYLQTFTAMTQTVSRPLASATPIDTGSPLRLLSDTLLLLCVMEICSFGSQDWPLQGPHQFIGGVDVGVGQPRALDLGLGGSRVSQPASSPAPSTPRPALWLSQPWGPAHSHSCNQSSDCPGMEPWVSYLLSNSSTGEATP